MALKPFEMSARQQATSNEIARAAMHELAERGYDTEKAVGNAVYLFDENDERYILTVEPVHPGRD